MRNIKIHKLIYADKIIHMLTNKMLDFRISVGDMGW